MSQISYAELSPGPKSHQNPPLSTEVRPINSDVLGHPTALVPVLPLARHPLTKDLQPVPSSGPPSPWIHALQGDGGPLDRENTGSPLLRRLHHLPGLLPIMTSRIILLRYLSPLLQ